MTDLATEQLIIVSQSSINRGTVLINRDPLSNDLPSYYVLCNQPQILLTVSGLQVGPQWIPEKAMATHSSTLAWKIPWMEEPGGLQSMEWDITE